MFERSELENNLILPTFTPQVALLGIFEYASNDSTVKTMKYIVFKQSITFYLYLSYMCLSPEKKIISLNKLIAEIRKVKAIEKENALTIVTRNRLVTPFLVTML